MNGLVYDKILKEYFDTSDRRSMRLLLSLNEADQNQAMISLASKLYEKIIAKVDDIDFGTIPASKGDITKIGNFQEMRECIDTIAEILAHYKQDSTQLNTITKAIDNLKDSKSIWEKAYAVNCEFAITFYNTIALSIVSGVSLLISSCIDFIKEPGDQSFQVSFDKIGYSKTKDKLLFQNLEKFNASYAKGDIERLMSNIVKTNSSLKESTTEYVEESVALLALIGVVGAGTLAVVLLTVVIPILHELTVLFYCTLQDISEFFEVQAKLLQFNAEQLKYDYTKTDSEVKKIYDKQMKIVDRFRKISDIFSIKMNKADKQARKEIQKDKVEKYTVDDVQIIDNPDMTSSSIF